MPSTMRVKRAAVCVTGLTECTQEVWARNELKLRQRLNGDIDVFLFLSTGDGTVDEVRPDLFKLGVKEARMYNSTINIVRQDVVNIDPRFPKTCDYQYHYTGKNKIIPIEQERLAQANCYDIVREYEQKRRIRYQLLVRARTDSVYVRLPTTFERSGKFNLSNAIIVPNEHHYYGVNDRFAIGSIDLMKHYMRRWHQLRQCITNNVHPESFLAFVLNNTKIRVIADSDISLVQVPHGKNQCH